MQQQSVCCVRFAAASCLLALADEEQTQKLNFVFQIGVSVRFVSGRDCVIQLQGNIHPKYDTTYYVDVYKYVMNLQSISRK